MEIHEENFENPYETDYKNSIRKEGSNGFQSVKTPDLEDSDNCSTSVGSKSQKNSDDRKHEQDLLQEEFEKEYDPNLVYRIFVLIFVSNVLINIDHGALPGCFDQVKEKFAINNFQFGLLGSVVFGGLTIGSAVAAGAYSKGEWIKPTLIAALSLNALVLFLFTATTNFTLTVMFRALIGFFQVFICIYQPVWADTYGSESQKSIWLTVFLLAPPLGVVLGYTATYWIKLYYTWEWSFRIQALCLIPCIYCLYYTPSRYLNIQMTITYRLETQKKIEQQLQDDNRGEANFVKLKGFGEYDNQSFFEKLQSIKSNVVFIKLCMSMTGLYFVVTGIQYWLPDYMQNVMEIEPELAAWYFAALCFTAPITGVVIGGIATTYLGGYNDHRAQILQQVMGACAVLCALPIPFFDPPQRGSFVICLWGLLFFGGFILPPVTGIMLNSVSEYQRTSANSVANLSYNLLGYAPAPCFYGMVSHFTGGEKSRWAMGCLLYSTFISITFLLSGIKQKLEEEKNLEMGEQTKGKSLPKNERNSCELAVMKTRKDCNDSNDTETGPNISDRSRPEKVDEDQEQKLLNN